MNWLEEINKLKSLPVSAEKILALKSDSRLTQGIIAWQNIHVARKESTDPVNDSMNAIVDWLWETTDFDKDQWRIMSGFKVEEVDTIFQRLKGLKLIYPDGTVDDLVTLYLRSVVNKLIYGEAKPVGRPKKVKEGEQ
jgi:hypothetical protein